jgi:hypothetical protein
MLSCFQILLRETVHGMTHTGGQNRFFSLRFPFAWFALPEKIPSHAHVGKMLVLWYFLHKLAWMSIGVGGGLSIYWE